MNFEVIIPLLTAFGLGSIVTAVVQSFIKRREWIETRNFRERKEAYIGLLEAYHKAAVSPSNEAAKEFAYWQLRCELVAPDRVCKAIARIVETNDDQNARHTAHEDLKRGMRRDLGIISD